MQDYEMHVKEKQACFPSAVLVLQSRSTRTFVPWASDVSCLGLLDSKLLYTKHLLTVTNKAMAFFVVSFLHPLEISPFHRKLKQPSVSSLSDPFALTSPLYGVPHVTQTTSNSKSYKISAYA